MAYMIVISVRANAVHADNVEQAIGPYERWDEALAEMRAILKALDSAKLRRQRKCVAAPTPFALDKLSPSGGVSATVRVATITSFDEIVKLLEE